MSDRAIYDTIGEEGEGYFRLVPEKIKPVLPLVKHSFYAGAMCAVLLALRKHVKHNSPISHDLLSEIVEDIHMLSEQALSEMPTEPTHDQPQRAVRSQI